METIKDLQPQHPAWSRVPLEKLEPGIERQMIVGENLMICRLHIGPKVVTPPHDHPHEQMTIVEKGRVLFTIGDAQRPAQAGDVLLSPGEVMLRLDSREGRIHTTRNNVLQA